MSLQIHREQCQDHIRLHEAIAIVDDAESIGIAIGREPEVEFFGADDLAELTEVFFVAFGGEAAEVRIAEVVDDFDFETRFEEEVIEIVARCAV